MKEAGPVSMTFTVPMYNASRLQVKCSRDFLEAIFLLHLLNKARQSVLDFYVCQLKNVPDLFDGILLCLNYTANLEIISYHVLVDFLEACVTGC